MIFIQVRYCVEVCKSILGFSRIVIPAQPSFFKKGADMQKNILFWVALGAATFSLSGCVAVAPVVAAGAAGAGTANVAGSSATMPQQLTDIRIKSQISSIANRLKIENANIEVTVFNGIVLFLGQVPTAQNKNDLVAQASKLEDVVIVYNQLTVGPNIAFSTYANDSWITSKVKANMIPDVNPLHFVVVTQEGVVYLLGQVTQDEGDTAAKIASETSGVTSVVKIFNYIAPTAAVPSSMPAVNSVPAAATPVSTPSAAPSSGIPEYAPTYAPVETQVGPAASD
jgi:osmotically-inducible protein OsmY